MFFDLNLSVNAFVFVIIAVVMAAVGVVGKEAYHLVLVQIHFAEIGVGVFVIFVEFTAFTACLLLRPVFRKIHSDLRFAADCAAHSTILFKQLQQINTCPSGENRAENQHGSDYYNNCSDCQIELKLYLTHFLGKFFRGFLRLLALRP